MTIEYVHKAVARPARIGGIVLGGILLGVGYINIRPDALNVEGRKIARDAVVLELLLAKVHLLEVAVKDINSAAAEVCRQDKFVTINFRDGGAFVNGSVCCVGYLGMVNYDDRAGAVHSRIPTLDRSILAYKDENSRRTGSQ